MTQQQAGATFSLDEIDGLIEQALSPGVPSGLALIGIRQLAARVEQARQQSVAARWAERQPPEPDAAPETAEAAADANQEPERAVTGADLLRTERQTQNGPAPA